MSGKKKIPLRKCVGCQEMKNKKDMIRILRNQAGEFLIDETGRKNGRGAYLCPDEACLEKAIASRGLERSFGQAIPAEVYESLKKELQDIEAEKSHVAAGTGPESRPDKKR